MCLRAYALTNIYYIFFSDDILKHFNLFIMTPRKNELEALEVNDNNIEPVIDESLKKKSLK